MNNKYFNNILSGDGKIVCYVIICLILLLRLTSLNLYDLNDTTEARYAGIAMRMANSNDFVTSYIEPSVPFLAKPPLSFWITAVSFKMFGINEFAARLPHLLFGILLVVIIYNIFYRLYDAQHALILSAILVSIPSFVIMSGLVMTESILIFCISIAMLSAWIRLEKNGNIICSYIFFASLGFAMLAKGPIGIIMTCTPLAIYLTIYKKWTFFFQEFNIFSGSLLSIIIFLPWYVMEEIRNPGFLCYFLLGEHFGRFLIPGWKGDLYGNAHNEPIGTMLWYFIVSTMPWVLYPLISFIRKPIALLKTKFDRDIVFFSCFTSFPVIFFIPARNIIISYGMFCIVPFAILMMYYFEKIKIKKLPFIITALICPIALCCTIILNNFYFILDNSDKKYVQFAQKKKQHEMLYFKSDIKYSSRFYSNDKVKMLEHENELKQLPNDTAVVMYNSSFDSISNALKHNLKRIICDHRNDRCLYQYQNN